MYLHRDGLDSSLMKATRFATYVWKRLDSFAIDGYLQLLRQNLVQLNRYGSSRQFQSADVSYLEESQAGPANEE